MAWIFYARPVRQDYDNSAVVLYCGHGWLPRLKDNYGFSQQEDQVASLSTCIAINFMPHRKIVQTQIVMLRNCGL